MTCKFLESTMADIVTVAFGDESLLRLMAVGLKVNFRMLRAWRIDKTQNEVLGVDDLERRRKPGRIRTYVDIPWPFSQVRIGEHKGNVRFLR